MDDNAKPEGWTDDLEARYQERCAFCRLSRLQVPLRKHWLARMVERGKIELTRSPVSASEILAALIAGNFKPLSEDDRLAFFDASDDAVIWFANDKTCVLISSVEGGSVVFEVYDNSAYANVWQGVLSLGKL